ncbi:HEXXH motif-containing protein [Streptomyces sp. DpondAA-F4]|nr:HEXXH motif-containing protein [Streptomyces sp. DpondAA-F4]
MYAPIRMPGPLFDEIAAGGGSPEAVAFLVRGERTRRLLLLRELLDRLDADPALLGPLDATAVWSALEAAAARAPGPVDDLLLSPQVGSWLAHTLRRLHGTASGPPLWADAGQLAAVAAAAAVHAGTEAELLLPARGAAVSLPALGMVRLPGPDGDDFHAVPAQARGGRITVHGPHGPGVTVRPLDAPESAHWMPVHRLGTGPGSPPSSWTTWTRTATWTSPSRPIASDRTSSVPGTACSGRPWSCCGRTAVRAPAGCGPRRSAGSSPGRRRTGTPDCRCRPRDSAPPPGTRSPPW